MSKLLRSELKEIVKECLVEILAEGIGRTQKKQHRQNTVKKPLRNKKSLERRRTYLESMDYGDIPVIKEEQEKAPPRKINTDITQDPVINSILADTAKTTLQEQISADRKGAPNVSNMDRASMIASQNKPEDLFGKEASSKWAQLAFFNQ